MIHTPEFKALMKNSDPAGALRKWTHAQPLFVFWVAPDGEILNAGTAHHDNPPKGDGSVLTHPSSKGYLRGRAALIGAVIYAVIYGDRSGKFTVSQKKLLAASHANLTSAIFAALPENDSSSATAIFFINEAGKEIEYMRK